MSEAELFIAILATITAAIVFFALLWLLVSVLVDAVDWVAAGIERLLREVANRW